MPPEDAELELRPPRSVEQIVRFLRGLHVSPQFFELLDEGTKEFAESQPLSEKIAERHRHSIATCFGSITLRLLSRYSIGSHEFREFSRWMVAFGSKVPELEIVSKKKAVQGPEVVEVIRYRDRPVAILGGISGFAATLPSVAAPMILSQQVTGKAFALTTIPVLGVAGGTAPVSVMEQPSLTPFRQQVTVVSHHFPDLQAERSTVPAAFAPPTTERILLNEQFREVRVEESPVSTTREVVVPRAFRYDPEPTTRPAQFATVVSRPPTGPDTKSEPVDRSMPKNQPVLTQRMAKRMAQANVPAGGIAAAPIQGSGGFASASTTSMTPYSAPMTTPGVPSPMGPQLALPLGGQSFMGMPGQAMMRTGGIGMLTALPVLGLAMGAFPRSTIAEGGAEGPTSPTDALLGQVTLVAPNPRAVSDKPGERSTAVEADWKDIARTMPTLDAEGISLLKSSLPAGAKLLYPALPPSMAGPNAVNFRLSEPVLGSLLVQGYGPAAAAAAPHIASLNFSPSQPPAEPVRGALVPHERPFGAQMSLVGAAERGESATAMKGGTIELFGMPVRLASSLTASTAVRNEVLAKPEAQSGAMAAPQFQALRERVFPGAAALSVEPKKSDWEKAAPSFGLRDAEPSTILSPDARVKMPTATSSLPQLEGNLQNKLPQSLIGPASRPPDLSGKLNLATANALQSVRAANSALGSLDARKIEPSMSASALGLPSAETTQQPAVKAAWPEMPTEPSLPSVGASPSAAPSTQSLPATDPQAPPAQPTVSARSASTKTSAPAPSLPATTPSLRPGTPTATRKAPSRGISPTRTRGPLITQPAIRPAMPFQTVSGSTPMISKPATLASTATTATSGTIGSVGAPIGTGKPSLMGSTPTTPSLGPSQAQIPGRPSPGPAPTPVSYQPAIQRDAPIAAPVAPAVSGAPAVVQKKLPGLGPSTPGALPSLPTLGTATTPKLPEALPSANLPVLGPQAMPKLPMSSLALGAGGPLSSTSVVATRAPDRTFLPSQPVQAKSPFALQKSVQIEQMQGSGEDSARQGAEISNADAGSWGSEINVLAGEVYQLIKRRIVIDRERRGRF